MKCSFYHHKGLAVTECYYLLKGRIYYSSISLCSSVGLDLCARFVAESKRCWNISVDTWSFSTGRIQKARGLLQSAGFHSAAICPRPKDHHQYISIVAANATTQLRFSLTVNAMMQPFWKEFVTPVVERPFSHLRKGQMYTCSCGIWVWSWFRTFSSTDWSGAWRWWVFYYPEISVRILLVSESMKGPEQSAHILINKTCTKHVRPPLCAPSHFLIRGRGFATTLSAFALTILYCV